MTTNGKTVAKEITILLKLLGFCQYIFCTAIAVGNVDFQKICNSFPPFTTEQIINIYSPKSTVCLHYEFQHKYFLLHSTAVNYENYIKTAAVQNLSCDNKILISQLTAVTALMMLRG